VFRPLARIVVMGRTLAVPVFEIVGLKEEIAPRTRECLGLFAQALDRFYARDWDGAQAGFRRSAELEPLVPGLAPGVKGNPSLIYQGLVEEYRQMKLPDDWDGVHVMQHK
jgi:adenylate cyclase